MKRQYSSTYVPLSLTQICDAQHTDIATYLLERGEKVRKVGAHAIWDAHDSCIITGYMWYQNSTGKHGAAVSFLQHFFGLSFPAAVQELTKRHTYTENIQLGTEEPTVERIEKHKPADPILFQLPPAAENHRRLFAYLNQTRKISADVITEFLLDKLIYQDQRGNIVFVCYDNQGIPRAAHLRGTNTQVRYRQFIDGGDFLTGFHYTPANDFQRLFVFEAAIDLMSFITLHRHTPWHRDAYLSLGGLSDLPLKQFLKQHRSVKELYLCLDNDVNAPKNYGQDAAQKLMRKYKDRYTVRIITPKVGKDWNELLLSETEKVSCIHTL